MAYFHGFINGANHQTLNLASIAWILYSQAHDLVSSDEVSLGLATNNIVEYHAVIGLLNESSSHGANHIIVYLDSNLVVSQLNHIYAIYNPVLLRFFQRVHIIEQSFESITYQHVPRCFNSNDYSLANYILDWHIAYS